MQKLTKSLLNGNTPFPQNLQTQSFPDYLPERVLQFGEGNFLRAFADWMFHQMNKKGLFNGRVVVVQPVGQDKVALLNEQDGLFTLSLRGMQEGKAVVEEEIISSVSRCINVYSEWSQYLACAENSDIEFVISNTTESGIVYHPGDRPEDQPPVSFPGKLAVYLHHRYKYFNGDPRKGLVILPCELIEQNGEHLKRIILQLSDEWGWSSEFKAWLETSNYFLNTLVDRVVSGFPAEEIEEIWGRLGYIDRLVDVGEFFHLWVIEGPAHLAGRLPFDKAGLNVVWTDDLTPYRTLKVRILNGAHLCCAPAAFLAGVETVRGMVDHDAWGKFARRVIFDEIVPSIDLANETSIEYARVVLERFGNPFIKHPLKNILLNAVSKFKVRVLPSIISYIEKNGHIPPKMCFSLAALIALYHGHIQDNGIVLQRNNAEVLLREELQTLEVLQAAWVDYDSGIASVDSLARRILENTQLWEQDLNAISGLTVQVAANLKHILDHGVENAVSMLLEASV